MNILETVGAAFVAIVVINLISMIWAIRKARMIESNSAEAEQEA